MINIYVYVALLLLHDNNQFFWYIIIVQLTNDTEPLGIGEGEFKATVIVLTVIAAISLVSFISVFIGVILITRRLKTIKAIKGQSYKRPSPMRP